MDHDAKECLDVDMQDVEVDAMLILLYFDVFYECDVILFFLGKLLLALRTNHWLNMTLLPKCNENLYVGQQGFYDVVFHSFKHGCVFLVHILISFDRGLIYVI